MSGDGPGGKSPLDDGGEEGETAEAGRKNRLRVFFFPLADERRRIRESFSSPLHARVSGDFRV